MKRCPQCGGALSNSGHKLITWGDLRLLACPNMPLGEIKAVNG